MATQMTRMLQPALDLCPKDAADAIVQALVCWQTGRREEGNLIMAALAKPKRKPKPPKRSKHGA